MGLAMSVSVEMKAAVLVCTAKVTPDLRSLLTQNGTPQPIAAVVAFQLARLVMPCQSCLCYDACSKQAYSFRIVIQEPPTDTSESHMPLK